MTAASAQDLFAPGTATDVVQFFERWRALPRTGLVPRLSDYFDTAPAHLQPNVTVVDVHGPSEMTVRLFGTALERTSGHYPTTHDLMGLYAEPIRALACRLVWTAASHPVGYTCVRHVRTTAGRLITCPSIGLPVLLDTGQPLCFITYANIENAREALARCDQLEVVQDIVFGEWIDLGAGTPAQAQ